MFGPRTEEDFVNDATAGRPRGRGRGPWLMLVMITGGIAAFLAWAALYEIEEVTRGTGRVVPTRQLQVVQSLEGGIVSRINIREGDPVQEGDVLMRIDDTSAGAERGELREREAALLAEAARTGAEAKGAETLTFPEGLAERAPGAVAAEREVFLSRRAQLESELSVLRDKLAQRRSDLRELQAGIVKLETQIAPLAEEIDLTGDLVDSGAVPRIELLRLQSRMAELKGDLEVSRARLPRIRAAIREAESQIRSARTGYVLTARERLARINGDLAVLREALRAATEKVSRTSLRAPVNGTVNTVHVTTIGAVVQPGAPLIEIVPRDDRLLIEARIRPRDVAFIRPGDSASVKITAYDYLVYGALDGIVQRIGADTVEDSEGTEFFRVMVRTQRSALEADDGATLPISPGMVAQVDILTGRKTVLDYLSRPLMRAKAEALRER
ncbi:HlyD family type I secretion periplasmic adaptor subunit [Roseovarius sp. TE539]|uniref:HlyD family type I secretion periplasmic adaptor subunit n=1 Tax=Roseovarius sp. TE539 TaxID=2249812 RepID=UPI000DDD1155|nr:HlyD family type I secretion periplasmic adaptor subunit [Roseovarius sp. TE539]RBI71225.1 HlyD family type I secretion periplasmic adaptor subunit [Roseovarius sp. TE539]